MANYFTSSHDATYLDSATQARSDIALLRTDAEAAVIAYYRRSVPDMRWTHGLGSDDIETGLENLQPSAGDTQVYLRWYHADADDVGASAQELIFLDSMRREIAGMIQYLASRRPIGGASERAVKSETRGRRTVVYSDSQSETEYPAGFGRYLKPFDIRPVVWV